MKRIIIPLFFALAFNTSYAQSNYEIYKIAQSDIYGSARSQGLGGAGASIGGDYSGVSLNPANLGVYRQNQAGVTTAFNIGNTTGDYQGKSTDDQKNWFSFNQFFYIHSSAKGANRKDISSYSWGIGLNRVQNFNERYSYVRGDQHSSFIDVVADQYNTGVDKDRAWYAWDVGITDTVDGKMVKSFQADNNPTKQTQHRTYSGSMSEFNFSMAYNQKNKLMLGLGLGVPVGSYETRRNFKEVDQTGQMTNFDFYSYNELVSSTLIGINAKLGMTYQPVPTVRISAHYQTPTSYSIDEIYSYNFTSNVEGYAGLYGDQASQDFDGLYTYRMVGASKYGASGTFLFGNKGLITMDYLRQNPQFNKVIYDGVDADLQNEVNQSVRNEFTSTNTFKFGAEGRLDNLYLRGGVNYTTSPYSNGSSANEVFGFAFGVGGRNERFSYDLTYARQTTKFEETPYVVSWENPIYSQITSNVNRVILSIGFR